VRVLVSFFFLHDILQVCIDLGLGLGVGNCRPTGCSCSNFWNTF